jgi:class 3 adenylate cyclase
MPGRRSSDLGDQATQTVLFADLAGFTALTEAHGDEHAAKAAVGPVVEPPVESRI